MTLSDTGYYVIGVTSIWILAPVAVSVATPEPLILKLHKWQRVLRTFLLFHLLVACAVSLAAWYHWNEFTGPADYLCCSVALLGSTVFGVSRQRWVRTCTITASMFTLASFLVEQRLEKYQPWPHLVFRNGSFATVFTSVNAGLAIPGFERLLIVVALGALLHWIFIFIEWRVVHWPSRGYAVLDDYLTSVARGSIFVFVFSAFALCFFPRPEDMPLPKARQTVKVVEEQDCCHASASSSEDLFQTESETDIEKDPL